MKSKLLKLLKKLDGFHEDIYHSGEKDLQKIANSLNSAEDQNS
ncbi:hypothetical protein [Kordia sp. SMS9]|nr:hypothetical protein [Kordia sp. SMS9]